MVLALNLFPAFPLEGIWLWNKVKGTQICHNIFNDWTEVKMQSFKDLIKIMFDKMPTTNFSTATEWSNTAQTKKKQNKYMLKC